MRKFKILSILMCLVLLVSAFTGCGTVEVSKLYDTGKIKKSYEKDVPYSTYSKLSYENKIVESFGNIIVFEDTNATQNIWTFYDYAKGSVVYTETQPASYDVDIEFVSCGENKGVFAMGYTWIDGNGKTQYKIAVRDLNGLLIKDFQSEKESEVEGLVPSSNLDLLKIGNEIYRLNKDDVYELVAKFSDASVIPTFEAKNGDNYYVLDTGKGAVTVYNKKLVMTGCYNFPSYANQLQCFILNNGDVLVQYQVAESLFSDDYTFVDEMVPITLVTQVIEVDSGEIEDKDLDHVIVGLQSRETLYEDNVIPLNYEFLKKNIKNGAIVQEIDDGKLDKTLKVVNLSNSGKIADRFDDVFVGQPNPTIISSTDVNLGLPNVINHERFVVSNVAGMITLTDASGRVIGDITAIDKMNNKYIVMNDTIYDYDLKEVASCKDYVILENYYLQNSFVFKKSVDGTLKYFLFTNGEFKLIANAYDVTILSAYKNVLTVKNNTSAKISVYTESLNVMFTTDATISLECVSEDGGLVLYGYNQTTSKYETYIIK